VGGVSRRLGEQRSLALKKSNTNTQTLLGSKMGHILAIFMYGTSSGPPWLELKRFVGYAAAC